MSVAGSGDKVIVSSVEPGGLAQKMGVQKGDVVTQVDGQDVRTAQDFEHLVAKARAKGMIALVLSRANTTLMLSFPLS